MKDFGQHLKDLRGKKSIREVSKEVGISHSYLSSLEKGYDPRTKQERKPTPEVIKKIATAFNIDYFDLLLKAGYITEMENNRQKALEKELAEPEHSSKKYDNDILIFLEDNKEIYYNGNQLSSEDKKKIADVLKAIFPEHH